MRNRSVTETDYTVVFLLSNTGNPVYGGMMSVTGFYRNMSTGDYDEYRDTKEVQSKYAKRQPSKSQENRRFNSDDLRPVGEDDEDY